MSRSVQLNKHDQMLLVLKE